MPYKQQMKRNREIYFRHTAKRGNRPLAMVLTAKALKEILLALRIALRNTNREQDYLKWVIEKIEKQLPPELRKKPLKRRKS